MDESQVCGMQHLPRGRVVRDFFEVAVLAVPVDKITDERMPDELEMNPDLVSAAGVYVDFGQGRAAEPFHYTICGARIAADVFCNRHAFPVRRMPGDGGAYFPAIALHFSADNRIIDFFDLSTRELY
jgi:hypothetical protein